MKTSSKNEKRSYRQAGQSNLEVAVGIIITIPIIWFFLDVGVMVMANQLNDNLARNAARSAASASINSYNNGNKALAAVHAVCASFQESLLIKRANNNALTYFDWNPPSSSYGASRVVFGSRPAGAAAAQPGQVVVVTAIRVNYPVTVPYLGQSSIFQSKAIWPIVSVPPNN